MIVLDTTVLVYAVGAQHRMAEPCRRLIESIGEGRVTATTTPEVIQEFVHVRARRRARGDAVALGRAYAELLSPLMVIDARALTDGLGAFARSKKIGAFDAVLAATALLAEAEAIVSADAAFAEVRGLTHWDPAGAELKRVLAVE